MPPATGKELSNCNRFRNKSQFTNLKIYTKDYLKLEDVVKRANAQDVIFPDFLTLDNIFIDEQGNYQFIDYEGIQIKDNFVMAMSTSLENQKLYDNPKYKINQKLFTNNLDKKSLLYYYFLNTLNVNLANVGILDSYGNPITLDYIFYKINLTDYDFMPKIWVAMQNTGTNEYIGDDVLRMSEKYTLDAIPIGNGLYLKIYRKK